MPLDAKRKIRSELILLFAILLLCDTAAQLLFKRGVTDLGEIPLDTINHLQAYLWNLASNGYVWLGVVSIVTAFFCWLAVISKVDLSKAHLITCSAYATVPVGSVLMLNETISFKQVLGVALICIGAYISSKSNSA